MFYLVYGIILVVLIAGSVMAAKYWHWVNTVFLILTFLAGIAATLGMAKVFYKRSQIVSKYNRVLKDHANASEQLNTAIYGKPSDIGYGENSLRGVSNKLNLELMGRGRVWSGGTVTNEGDNWKFKFVAAVPEDEGNQLAQLKQFEVQVFRDQVINGRAYPVGYIGKFRVNDATREGFVLQALQVVDNAEAASPTATWSIYEKMPLDRRGAFKDAIAAVKKDLNVDEMSIDDFRQVLSQELFPADKVPLDVESAQYERLIDSYAFDGQSLGKIENWVDANAGSRKSGPFQPRPEEVQVKYRFNKASKEYTVDAEGNLETDGPFTPLGYAVSRNLHLGKKVTFEEGDEITIDQLSAEGYQRDGVAVPPFPQTEDVTEIDRIYVRKYRDYPFMFSSLQSQAVKLNEALAGRKKDNATHDNAIAKNLDEQIQERVRIQGDLESDIANLEKDRDVITAAETKKEEEVNRLQQKVDQLLKEEIQLRRQVGAAAARIGNINRRTTSVSTGGGDAPSTPVIDNATSPIYGTPLYNEPVYQAPVYQAPVYEAPVNREPLPIYQTPQPIYSQPREIQSVPAPIVIPPLETSREPGTINFSDQSQPRDATGTRTIQPLNPIIESPTEESVFESFQDVN